MRFRFFLGGGGGLLTLRSGQRVGSVLSRNVGKYQSPPRNVPEERRSQGLCLSHMLLNGVVGVVPRLWAGQSWVRIPVETYVYLLQTAHTDPRAHRYSYLKDIVMFFVGVKVVGASG